MPKKISRITVRDYKTAGSFWGRLSGLMFKKNMPGCEVLFFPRCGAIHTFFMRFPIDVIMTDNNYAVVDFAEGLKPFTIFSARGAKHTFEAAGGFIKKNKIKKGDFIRLYETKRR